VGGWGLGTGVMLKRLDEKEALSGVLSVTDGMICEMIELRGSERPGYRQSGDLEVWTIVPAANA